MVTLGRSSGVDSPDAGMRGTGRGAGSGMRCAADDAAHASAVVRLAALTSAEEDEKRTTGLAPVVLPLAVPLLPAVPFGKSEGAGVAWTDGTGLGVISEWTRTAASSDEAKGGTVQSTLSGLMYLALPMREPTLQESVGVLRNPAPRITTTVPPVTGPDTGLDSAVRKYLFGAQGNF